MMYFGGISEKEKPISPTGKTKRTKFHTSFIADTRNPENLELNQCWGCAIIKSESSLYT